MTTMITIKKATINDVSDLIYLSRDIYKEHYLYLWHPGGAEWYMETYAYNKDKIKTDINDPDIEYFIAIENGLFLGYMKILLSASLAGYEMLDALEVERIYLYKNETGKGIGKQFMELALQKARFLKKNILFVKAMDSGKDAIAFYKKLGYIVCGNMQLPLPLFSLMKEEFRGMVLMKKEIRV